MSEKTNQTSFLLTEENTDGPVTCLGHTFKDDNERREYFKTELRKKLPELKSIEGFPFGNDEDIIALSDPPFYTACPNPWLKELINEWGKNKNTKDYNYSINKRAFASDVKEGKNDPVYLAHSYHTKVPYKAIMRYLLHYTEPGDIVLDSFAGSGMTGVATQYCADKSEIETLGYTIDNEGIIYQKNENGEEVGVSKVGKRNSVLVDLSPAATFITYNYNKPTNVAKLEETIFSNLNEFNKEHGYLYGTIRNEYQENSRDLQNKLKEANNLLTIKRIYTENQNYFGQINYIVYSDVYICSSCTSEINYWESTVEPLSKKVTNNMVCPKCKASHDKNKLERVWLKKFDKYINDTVRIAKQVPVWINYSYKKKRFEKAPDEHDLKLIKLIEESNVDYWIPTDSLPKGHNLDQPQKSHGISHIHHFYTDRTLCLLGNFLKTFQDLSPLDKQFILGSILPKLTKMNRYMPQHGSRALVGPMANVLYFPSMYVENNVLDQLEFQSKKIVKGLNEKSGNIITTQSSTELSDIPSNSIDYIFIDPPFGANIMYSELNFVRESWFKVKTNNGHEVIENRHQQKTLDDYKLLMISALKEAYRVLKPSKWITVEFSNTKASVWNAIQHALQEVGFVIAGVDALDKSRGGLYSMITAIGVKQDLIITAYKPSDNVKETIKGGNDSVHDVISFVDNHLSYLPVTKGVKGNLSFIAERDIRIIYDRLIAYFVRSGRDIPISAGDFQELINVKFPIRDGMVFLNSQVAEYEKKRVFDQQFKQMNFFITDESSSIEWIRQILLNKPQTRQDIHPRFMKEIQHIAKHELLPELDSLLEQNFLIYEGNGEVPSQIHGYLSSNYKDLRGLPKTDSRLKEKAKNRWYVPDPNKQADLEKLREKSLLREFDSYKTEIEGNKKKLKQFRTEAIRTGFKKAWGEKDYETIVKIGERLPEKVLQEDDKLLMYFDNAQIRLGV